MHANEDADNSNEKELDNLDVLVNEKTISLALACNFANGSKKSLVLGQDLNHIISVKLQIKDGKIIQVNRHGRTNDFSSTRHQC